MKYVGVCFKSGGWGDDLTGLLVVETPEGWFVTASHISSNESYSKHDIEKHYERHDQTSPDDTFEWIGLLTKEEVEKRFGWSSPEVTT